MKVLVTGAKGMLGQDLCPIFEDAGAFVIETDVDTLDITNAEQVKQVLTDIRPDLVVHCAAYTNVDKAEEDLKTAELINVTGTENIAEACGKLGITLVYISTDYVFDGTKNSPYKPDDKPNPINIYGKSKLKGEEAVQKHCKRFYIARTSWLYGHYGKNFVETMLTLAKKVPDGEQPELKVVNDQFGCPTWTMDLAGGIAELLEKPYGVYHLCGSGETSWYGFAKEIFKLANIETDLKPCETKDFPRPAKRPLYSVMDNGKILRNWKSALKDYLELRTGELL